MLGIDTRAARVVWTILLAGLGLVLVYYLRRTLLVFVAALFLAYLLSPLVDLAVRLLPRKVPRAVALALVYAILIAGLVVAGMTVGTAVARQATVLADHLPRWIDKLQQPFSWPIPLWLKPLAANVVNAVQSSAQESIPFFQEAGRQTLAFLSNAVYGLLVPILAFFFLKDGAGIRNSLVGQFPAGRQRELLEDILADLDLLLAHYVRALLLLCLASFTSFAIFFSIAGVPFALLLATLAGFLEFIPMIGPLVAGVTILLVAWFNGYPHLLVVFLFLLIYRGFQDYVLSPHLMSAGAELHPLLVIFGVLAGDQIGGIAGIFLSVPVIATLRIIHVRYQKSHASTLTMVE